jgi:hypothetical protein
MEARSMAWAKCMSILDMASFCIRTTVASATIWGGAAWVYARSRAASDRFSFDQGDAVFLPGGPSALHKRG